MAENKITVDNLPIDYSVQYEQQKSKEDEHLLDDAGKIRLSVERDTVQPSTDSALDDVIDPPSTTSWGGLQRPNGEGYNSARVFLSSQISNTFGSQEKLDKMAMRIEGIKDTNNSKADYAAQKKDVEKEANTLSSLVAEIGKINDSMEYIHGEIARFKKG